MKILDNPKIESEKIIKEIHSDLKYDLKPMVVDYLSNLFFKSLERPISIVLDDILLNNDLYLLYNLAEINLLNATIYIKPDIEKDIYSGLSYKVYLKIFEKYDDEISFEICSNFEKVETILSSIKYFPMRNDISYLLDLENQKMPYIKNRLLILNYLDLKYNRYLF